MTPRANCICGNATCKIPYGFCHCGCTKKTNIAPYSLVKRGHIIGKPMMFLPAHSRKTYEKFYVAGPFKIDGEYCFLIPLTQNQWALVSAEDAYLGLEYSYFAKWSKTTKSYYAHRKLRIGSKIYVRPLHREVLKLPVKYEGLVGDHENRITLDCRRSNLRPLTWAENSRNRKVHSNNKLGIKGVYRVGEKFAGRLWIGGKLVTLCVRDTPEEAGEMVYQEARRIYGQSARRD